MAKEKTRKEVIEKSFPKGEKIKLNQREEVKMLVERNGFTKGQIVEVHPTTAKQFIEMGIAEKA